MLCQPEPHRRLFLSCYRSLVAMVLLCLFSLCTSSHVAASSHEPNGGKTNLFSLPLEEVLNIRVDGSSDEDLHHNGVHILEGNGLDTALSSSAEFTPITLATTDTILLLVDGYTVGPVESVTDLNSYISELAETTSRIEVYLGESSQWWGDGEYSAVVNIVTGRLENVEVQP